MVMCCIDPGGASARSGGAGDAGASSSLRDAAIAHPGPTRTGRGFEAPGHRLPLLVMRPASRRNAILARGLENAVQPVTITRTGSKSLSG